VTSPCTGRYCTAYMVFYCILPGGTSLGITYHEMHVRQIGVPLFVCSILHLLRVRF